jgi:FG-GAP repeat protein
MAATRMRAGLAACAVVAAGLVPVVTGSAPVSARVGDAVFPDFNNDGRADAVVSIDQEDIGAVRDAGAVDVFYGSPFVSRFSNDQFLSNATPGMRGSPEYSERFGDATAAGDFNGDGFDDLAIGDWGATIDTFKAAGQVHILYGGPSGLTMTGYQHVDEAVAGVENNPQPDDEFGRALAAGDVNGDGMDDLVVGVPRKNLGGASNAGAVHVFEGGAGGLTFNNDLFFRQGSSFLGDSADAEDIFGSGLGVGDFNNDGRADIAIGVQGETLRDVPPNNPITDSGAFHILYGNATFANVGSVHQMFTELNLLGGARAGSRLGCTFAVGNFNGDAFDDLAACADGRRVGSTPNAGAVYVLKGSGSGLTATGNQAWSFSTPNVSGSPVTGDNFGDSITADDFNNDGRDDLAISVDRREIASATGIDHGIVLVIKGSPTLLTTVGAKGFSENTSGIAGVAQSGDEFGSMLQSGRYDADGFADLYIAAAGETVHGHTKAGGVYFLRGSSGGITPTGSKYFTEDTSLINEIAETNDFFGGT